MTLVDRQIKQRVRNGELISQETYNESQVGCISYDLTIDSFVSDEKTAVCDLAPGECVIAKTREYLLIPNDVSGVIGEKNSRIRQGLVVSGPRYFPGHHTYAFLRIQNVSSNVVRLESGNAIAQVFFETLAEVPDKPYNEQPSASFNEEKEYVGYGNYESEYRKQERSFQRVRDNILEKEQ